MYSMTGHRKLYCTCETENQSIGFGFNIRLYSEDLFSIPRSSRVISPIISVYASVLCVLRAFKSLESVLRHSVVYQVV